MELNQGTPPSQPLYYQMPPEDEIDLFELFSSLLSQWKLIIAITLSGALISTAVALSIPRVYESSTSVRAPTESQILPINENGYSQFTAKQLFKRFFDQVKSKENLKNYLIQTNPFPRMITNFNEKNLEQSAISFAGGLQVTLLEPEAVKGEVVHIPELFEVSLTSTNEAETVAVLNGYIQYIEERIIKEIKDEGFLDISLRSQSIHRDIQLLRDSAKRSRELLIAKMIENNATKIEELQQQIALLKEKKGKDVDNQIIHLQEAYQLAKSSGITKPTTLDMLAATNITKSAAPQTQINVGKSSDSMLFLLGTLHLSAKIKILQEREDLTPFIPEISKLRFQINTLENDTKLKELINRISDDPFIDELPAKMNELDRLKQINFEFGDAALYQVNQTASVDGVAEKPNRKLMVVLGTLLSGMLALFIALIITASQKRALRIDDGENS
ncbi:MAG: Wzz/FepE/Etk N-terminal domain-containing protein [Gammaproteobacteria bacterium]|nr:Wzz/FepE/Etk N-terminal domain-containing protein [Gammaproteobacteria bacterium]